SVSQVDSPRPGRAGERRRCVISWESLDGARETSFLLAPDEEVQDALVLPPSKFVRVPLLAVSVRDRRRSEPSLRLYKAGSGEQVRQYVGHAHRISALAASSDGRLLASTADDQTVCVWTLTDLDRILDRQGGLPGLVVEQRGGSLLVTRVDPDCPL